MEGMYQKDSVLLESALNGTSEPKKLSLSFLEYITNTFSEDREIGRGGFGVVYKGEFKHMTVAVKKFIFSNKLEEEFDREMINLLRVNHKNIVRIVGYCENRSTEYKTVGNAGVHQRVYNEERIICFEYMSSGSLAAHIHDELTGLDWQSRYKIIMEICHALNYLHAKNLVHRDLKPDNILMDNYMVPKIADLGISKLLDKGATKAMTTTASATWEYAPREFGQRVVSVKYDIYSLGLIIIELVTGCKDDPDVKNVLTRWRYRWNKSNETLRYQQVAKCLEIGLSCQDNTLKNRPYIWKIIKDLEDVDGGNGVVGQDQIPCWNELLWVEPPELFFPFQINKQMSCSLELHNETDAYMAFLVKTKSDLQYKMDPENGVIQPQSHISISITLLAQEERPETMWNVNEFTVKSKKVNEGLTAQQITKEIFSKKFGNIVDNVRIGVDFHAQRRATCMVEEPKELLSLESAETSFEAESSTHDIDNKSRVETIDVVLVYAFDCTHTTPEWNRVDNEIFWLVQEKLTHYKDGCLGYAYVMSEANTCTSDMKPVDPADTYRSGYRGSWARTRTACTKNMACGLSKAHDLIEYRGHWNSVILLFSDGMIHKGDFFDGAETFVSKVPVHTFTLGGEAYNNVLRAMSANSPGGRFHHIPVPDKPQLSIPFSRMLDRILNETNKEILYDFHKEDPTAHVGQLSRVETIDVVIVYAFDCTDTTPAWDKVDSGIFWMVQEKLKQYKEGCMGYAYVMSEANTCTSDMKPVDPAETYSTGYCGSSHRTRTACTKNMACGLSKAHDLIEYRGHWNSVILLFSDGMIHKGDFFDGAETFVSKIPVHTFTLGGEAYNNVLRAMAANSPGGRFHPIPITDKPRLSVPFSRTLDRILNETNKEIHYDFHMEDPKTHLGQLSIHGIQEEA